MFGLIIIYEFPDSPDPRVDGLEFYQSFYEAKQRTDFLINEFIEDYGKDYIERATEQNPMALASNGEVIWRGYIEKVQCSN